MKKILVKDKNKYFVIRENELKFEFTSKEYYQLHSKPIDSLVTDELDEVCEAIIFHRMYNYCVKLLSLSQRTSHEIRQKLDMKFYNISSRDKVIEDVLTKLYSNNYLTRDEYYIKNYCSISQSSKLLSKKQTIYNLAKKGIPLTTSHNILDDDSYDEISVIKKIIQKQKYKNLDDQQLIISLSRKGFSYSNIKEALKDRNLNNY